MRLRNGAACITLVAMPPLATTPLTTLLPNDSTLSETLRAQRNYSINVVLSGHPQARLMRRKNGAARITLVCMPPLATTPPTTLLPNDSTLSEMLRAQRNYSINVVLSGHPQARLMRLKNGAASITFVCMPPLATAPLTTLLLNDSTLSKTLRPPRS